MRPERSLGLFGTAHKRRTKMRLSSSNQDDRDRVRANSMQSEVEIVRRGITTHRRESPTRQIIFDACVRGEKTGRMLTTSTRRSTGGSRRSDKCGAALICLGVIVAR